MCHLVLLILETTISTHVCMQKKMKKKRGVHASERVGSLTFPLLEKKCTLRLLTGVYMLISKDISV